MYTFLDKDFDFNWGQMPRKLEDCGHFVTQTDGSLKRLHSLDDSAASGAGVFFVSIADRHFTCLRVLELAIPLESHAVHQTASYVTEAGRTVLVRHFCHPEKTMLGDQGNQENVVVDNDLQIVIDGVNFATGMIAFPTWHLGFSTGGKSGRLKESAFNLFKPLSKCEVLLQTESIQPICRTVDSDQGPKGTRQSVRIAEQAHVPYNFRLT